MLMFGIRTEGFVLPVLVLLKHRKLISTVGSLQALFTVFFFFLLSSGWSKKKSVAQFLNKVK